ncbi:MAG TPA: SUMF1/EgtB/PvdO family nonheme iron enzyme [Anaerolineae bacterium]|nr:SUMF1/EgtB/PvdO family nonheme iron enzyme [Anaerolineae bacterium]HNU05732.1 SUMF1/EgtB/PvdO family nonheme iron enzyme [Anaerolineae bacterium]
MDLSWINAIPEPLRTMLIGAAGDFAGGLAADVVGRLLTASGYQVRKRLSPGPQQSALNAAMAEALAVTVARLSEDPDLMAHYLTLFGQWAAREAVAGELSQVVDPRPDVTLDLDLLASEFEAAGYEPNLLGDVGFRDVAARFVGNFYDAAARQPALQGQIEIGLLRGIAERAEEQVQLLRRVAATLEQQPGAAAPAPQPGVSAKARGKGNVILAGEFKGDVSIVIGPAGQTLSAEQATAFLSGYLSWVRKMYDKAQLFGMDNPRTTQQPKRESLIDVFIPLTLRRFSPPSRRELAEALRGKVGLERNLAWYQLVRSEERAGEPVALQDLLTISDRLAIIGGAGSGKSTVLHYLAVTLARAIQEGEGLPFRLPSDQPLIPLLVPLRYYSGYLEMCQNAPSRVLEHPLTGTLAGFIGWHLRRSSKQGSEEFFHWLLKRGGCLLMIDGLDEIVAREQRGQVREQVEALVQADYPGNRVIVTAREAGFQKEAVFGDDFTRLDVQDLAPAEIWELVGNWCARLYPEDVEGNWDKLMTAIEEINERRREKALAPLISTPLMATMVLSVQWGETELPRERAALYEACVKAILQAQYTPEEGRREVTNWGGPWDAQRDWLCNLALRMHEGGRAGAALREEQVREIVGKSLAEDKVQAFLEAVRYRGGLFEERAEFFQFSHLTFQEFLAARLLARQREAGRPTLQPHVGESWWREVALLTYGFLRMDSGELFLGDDSPAVQHLRWLSGLQGSDEQRLAGAELAGASVLEIEKPDRDLRLLQANVLVALLEDRELSVSGALRAEAGRMLARLGDPRPGVGVRPDGVPDIAWCPVVAGEFLMGNTKKTDPQAFEDEMPQHRFTLPAFAIGKYPVTNIQFDAFVADGGYTEKWRECWTKAGWMWKGNRSGPEKYGGVHDLANHPVVGVRWYEAVAFCNWLGEKLGREVALPSEAQWERAARHTDGRRYPWRGSEITPDHANYAETGIGMTSAVGIFPRGAAECGALDMSGNVWEWTRSLWGKDFTEPSFVYPYDPADRRREDMDAPLDILRVVRGGSYYDSAWNVRCAIRGWYYPNLREGYNGFRVVMASP